MQSYLYSGYELKYQSGGIHRTQKQRKKRYELQKNTLAKKKF